MLCCVDGKQYISDFKANCVTFEEVGEVDEPFAAGGVCIGNEFVVGEIVAEDVGVDYNDAARVGPLADYVCVETMEGFNGAFGLTGVDGSLYISISKDSSQTRM